MSAATVALKMAASALMEKPASGRTVSPREVGQHHEIVFESVGGSPTAWTKSVAVELEIVRSHDAHATAGTAVSERSSTSTSGVLTSTEYAVTLERLRDLVNDEDEQDHPSEEAYARAFALLRTAAQHVGMKFPRGIAATGPGQAVRLLWSRAEKELRVVVGGSATNRSYIYWRVNGDSGIDETLEGSRLAEYLNWIGQDA